MYTNIIPYKDIRSLMLAIREGKSLQLPPELIAYHAGKSTPTNTNTPKG